VPSQYADRYNNRYADRYNNRYADRYNNRYADRYNNRYADRYNDSDVGWAGETSDEGDSSEEPPSSLAYI
jgi:hypothetical protein